MSAEDKHSKTEQPTGKRLEEARKKNPPPQSRDLTGTITLLAAVFALYSTGPRMFAILRGASRELLAGCGTYQVTADGVYRLMLKLMGTLGAVLTPFLVTVTIAGLAANFAQGGIVLSWDKLALKFDKFNPVNGVKRLFNKDAGVELAKSAMKIGIVGYVSYRIIRGETESIVYLSDRDLSDIFAFIIRLAFRLIVNSCGVLLALALLDLVFVKWRYMQNLRMTKHEVKQEHKENEGDPQIKGKIRRFQMEQSRRRLTKLIPTADVVITNPTHFAVALRYDREKMAAPVVIAKGADHLALRIKEIARENRVMLVENRFLARELYAKVKEGQEIPESLYAAVAEVLAYVFRLKGRI